LKGFVFIHPLARRNPLLRVGLAAVGLVLIGLASVFALVVAGSVLTLWLARGLVRQLRGPAPDSQPAQPTGVIEGEFRVVNDNDGRFISR